MADDDVQRVTDGRPVVYKTEADAKRARDENDRRLAEALKQADAKEKQ